MSKVETYQQAWSLALKGDFSLVDQIYHAEYRSFDLRTGIYYDQPVHHRRGRKT